MKSFIAWLAGAKAVGPDTELSFHLNQPMEGWQIFMICLSVVAFAVWIYRRDGRGTASPLLRTFLGVLRGLLIAIAVLILAEPVLLATNIETRRSTVLVLIDDSYSMELAFADADEALTRRMMSAMGSATVSFKDEDGKVKTVEAQKVTAKQFKQINRLDVLSAALKASHEGGKNFLEVLKDRHDVKLFGFARSVSSSSDDKKPIDPFHLTASGERGGETRIGDCLRQALQQTRGQPIAGIVIITDGRQNAGEDAVQAAQSCRAQRIPIFAVGIGDPSEPKDLEISVEGPDMIFPDDQTEVTVLFRYRGYPTLEPVKVELKDGEKVIASDEIKPGKPGEKTIATLRFKESRLGKYKYTASIPVMPGELRAENNSATYSFQVVDKKVKVLFVEGQDLPRWEYRYLKNALRRDHTIEVDALLTTGDSAFIWDGTDGKTPLDQFPVKKKEINEYDVLIIGDVSPSIFTQDQTNLIRDFVREGGGLIMIAGERFAPVQYLQGVWAEMLPVVPQHSPLAPPEGGFQDGFALELTPEGKKLPWTHMDTDENLNREIWENLPRMFWYYPVKRKKELATVVAVHPYDKDEQGNKMPIVATMPYGSGRTMFIGVDSLWRWRRGVGDKYHYKFYNQAIRYLSVAKRIAGQKRFYLGTDRGVVAIGDKVTISAIVKDQDYKEVTAEKMLVHGKTANGEDFVQELTRIPDRPGNYEGSYCPLVPGDFTIWLKDDAQPDAHQAEVAFKVEKPQLEFENPKLDEELLRSITRAGAPGGEYVAIDHLNDLPPKIQVREEKFPRDTPINLWDNWYMFAIFTVLITLEWVLRKRGRMI